MVGPHGTALKQVYPARSLFRQPHLCWLAPFSAMILLKILDVISFGLVEWVFVHVIIPVVNAASLGLLETQFSKGWLFAAAILLADLWFASIHEGFVGKLNACAVGWFLFAVMFSYGVVVAIVAHVVFDLIVHFVKAFCARYQPRISLVEIFMALSSRR